MRRILLVVACFAVLASPGYAQAPSADGVSALLGRLEQVVRAGDPNGFLRLVSQSGDRRRASEFASQMISPRITRATIRERDRVELSGTLPGDGYQLLVEAFIEYGARARLATWRLDVRRRGGAAAGAADEWAIADQQQLTSLQGLYHLSLAVGKQYSARDLVVTAEDLQLTLESGSVFVCETDAGTTALVLLGRGDMSFNPAPKVERSQVKLTFGSDALTSPFDVAFVRLPPGDFDVHVNRAALTERTVDPRDAKRADDVFRQEVGKSFGLDLGELSSETWSLLPNYGDFLAEIRTKRYETLTYARSNNEVEDVSLFDRKNRRNIALYSSKSHLQRYGRFFDEDDQLEFHVSHYDVDVSFNPQKQLIAGRTHISLETRAKQGTNTLTIKLADSLAVRSVVSSEFGRLLFVRVRNQNSIVVNLPSTVTSGYKMTLTVEYDGVLAPQPVDREALWPQQLPQFVEEGLELPIEENYLYSNRSYWYAQSATNAYATAAIRVTIPATYGCVASGDLASVTPVAANPRAGTPALERYAFNATQPLRYLAFMVASLKDVRTEKVRLNSSLEAVKPARLSGAFYDDVDLVTKANPRMRGRAKEMSKTAQDIMRFYTSITGDCPYPSLTLAVIERRLPGGHSPAYLSVVAQASPGSRLTFRDDPASFPEFPEFFLAHELAHQWWGQAVGWKNYHEQWLSEGFAQYFAALYAEKVRGRLVFASVMRRMRHWARDESDQGPVYLGYRIGHVKGDTRLFRAVVYNKGAVILHMLRQLLGDKSFFAGIRRFYTDWRFDKAGSDDLRRALEAESGASLQRFFEQWVYGQELPQVAVKWRVEQDGEGQQAVVRIEQSGETFDVPVTLTLDYLNTAPIDVVVKLNQPVVETRIPLASATLRRIDINRDATLAVVR